MHAATDAQPKSRVIGETTRNCVSNCVWCFRDSPGILRSCQRVFIGARRPDISGGPAALARPNPLFRGQLRRTWQRIRRVDQRHVGASLSRMRQKEGTLVVECEGIHDATGRLDNGNFPGPRAAANRLRLGDIGARISALREGRYEAATRLDNKKMLPNELVVRHLEPGSRDILRVPSLQDVT